MKTLNLIACFLLVASLGLVGCNIKLTAGKSGSDDKKDGGGAPQKPARVDWQSIPAEFHPSIDESEVEYSASETKYIDLNQFGFDKDVEVVYSNALKSGHATLKIYKVWADVAQWPALYVRQSSETLEIKSSGTYQCSISIKNNRVESVKGGCYLRIQLVLPEGAEIEVSNVGVLITKRFFAMSNEVLLQKMRRASFDKDKHAAIEEFLGTYSSVGKTPSLLSEELGNVLDQFAWAKEKLKALRSLHAYVTDRQNLGAMIDKEFGHFEREEARGIVGL